MPSQLPRHHSFTGLQTTHDRETNKGRNGIGNLNQDIGISLDPRTKSLRSREEKRKKERATYGQEFSNGQFLRLIAPVDVGEGSELHGGRAGGHKHEGEPEDWVVGEPVCFGGNRVDSRD